MSGAAVRPNPVRETLLSGGISIGPMVFEFFTPGLFAICKQAGADFVLLDMEHSGVGMDTIRLQLAAARGTGVAPLVRVPGNAYHLIAPVLDAGAFGIMVPLIEEREQAEEFANACRYRPEGRRGLGFSVAHDDYAAGEVPPKIQRGERAHARHRSDRIGARHPQRGRILSVPGIDVGWLGHYDLTDSMGFTGDFERPEFHAAVDALLGACAPARQGAGGPGDDGGADARVAPARIPLSRLWR